MLQTDTKLQDDDLQETKEMLAKHKVAVFIVAYNAKNHIEGVLNRIPREIRNSFCEIYIIDDYSKDSTYETAKNAAIKLGYKNLNVLRTPFNRGYGGNQKLGYLYAIRQGIDIAILLHGDGQYPPEYLPQIVNAFKDDKVGAVFASRMIEKKKALEGHMPLYKWVGNQVLTKIENYMLGTSLSEFHTGYRAYRVNSLKKIPFQYNSDDFHFDTEIIIQLVATKQNIKEISIPTTYGDEKCHVDGMKYAFNCIKSVIKYRLSLLGLFYEPNFDFNLFESPSYYFKHASNTLHQYILKQNWTPADIIADLGANNGELSAVLAEKSKEVVSVDIKLPEKAGKAKKMEMDLDADFDKILGMKKFDYVLALDVLEHLAIPEEAIKKIFNTTKPHGVLMASTANIGYFITRICLLFGIFNYGKRGILDMSHKRLFTIYSFKKLLTAHGFRIKKVEYFSPPIVDMVGSSFVLRAIDSISSKLAKIYPPLFAYNFLVVAERMDDIEDIYQKTFNKG